MIDTNDNYDPMPDEQPFTTHGVIEIDADRFSIVTYDTIGCDGISGSELIFSVAGTAWDGRR